jgi:hydroxyacylglutathione hydrolase
MDSVITIPALGDNFIYLYRYNRSSALVVDPGDASLVLETLKEHGLDLTTVLATHHHWDHTAGIIELKEKTGCKVIGPDKQRIPGIDCVIEDGEILAIGNTKIQVIATPGHTRTAVCYYVQPSNDNKNGILWTGDTLFVGGCGRLLECDARSMWDSLLKLASLPDDMLIYCGHDYTVENYQFALSIEPDNQSVQQCLSEYHPVLDGRGEVRQAQRAGRQIVPSTMSRERTTNPFLRADTPELKTALDMPQAQAVEVFAELRRRKDGFFV